ncbi:MAG: archaellin/type IV pilin N-terminal domain-containing protein [Desulfurococcaceae archaeon]
MKGISGIVATAILLALTIAGGVLMYTYVTSYLNTAVDTGKIVVENAYYITPLKRLTIEVRNVGTREVKVNGVDMILSGTARSDTRNITPPLSISPGEARQIVLYDVNEAPQYVIIVYGNSSMTEPVPVRVH